MDLYGKSEKNGIELLEVILLLKRNLKMILLFSVVCGAIGFSVSAFLMKPVYEASAKMIVNTGKGDGTNITNDQITSAQNLVKTYAIIIQSRTVLQEVIDELELSVSYEELQDMVSVSAVNGTQVMEISVKNGDPETAERITDRILKIAPDVIIEAVEAGSVKTIEKAHQSVNPVSPDKLKITVLAVLAGMITAFLFMMVRYILDTTYKSEQDIQNDLGIIVLGTIPSLESCRKGWRDRTGKRTLYGYGKK